MKKNLCLCLILSSLNLYANTMTVFAYPSKKDIDWSTPRRAIFDFLGIELIHTLFSGDKIESMDPQGELSLIRQYYKSTMGHTVIHIECTTESGEMYDKWTSFSGQNFVEEDYNNVVKLNMGLGVLFFDYIDGHIIDGQENINRLIYYHADRRNGKATKPRFLKTTISKKNCSEIKAFVSFFESFNYSKETTLEDLKKRPEHERLHFTTNIDPFDSYNARKENPYAKVGGGCAPYGVSLLKVVGKYDVFFEQIFKMNLEISMDQIGNVETNPIKLTEILLGKKGNYWKKPGMETLKMAQYDPGRIWKFIGEVQDCLKAKECSAENKSWLMKNASSVSLASNQSYKNTRIKKVFEEDVYGRQVEVEKMITDNVTVEGINYK